MELFFFRKGSVYFAIVARHTGTQPGLVALRFSSWHSRDAVYIHQSEAFPLLRPRRRATNQRVFCLTVGPAHTTASSGGQSVQIHWGMQETSALSYYPSLPLASMATQAPKWREVRTKNYPLPFRKFPKRGNYLGQVRTKERWTTIWSFAVKLCFACSLSTVFPLVGHVRYPWAIVFTVKLAKPKQTRHSSLHRNSFTSLVSACFDHVFFKKRQGKPQVFLALL